MKKVVGSLYKYIDKENTGVDFHKLLRTFYPNLDSKSTEEILKWIQMTDENKQQEIANAQATIHDVKAKPVLPTSGLENLLKVFRNMDNGKKGCMLSFDTGSS